MRRAGRWLVDVALLAALATGATLFGCAIVGGGSMRPALTRGDVVFFRRGATGLRIGSMILLGERPRAFVHRVSAVTPDGLLTTRGDANTIEDREPTSTAAVRGVVVAVLPLGRLADRLASSGGSVRLWSQSHRASDDGDGARAKASRLQGGSP